MRVGFKPHAGPQAFQHRHVPNGPEIEIVLHRALQLGRVLNGDHPIMRSELCQRIENRVDQRRLAASCRADDEDVLSRAHSGADHIRVLQTAHPIEKVITTAKLIQRIVLARSEFRPLRSHQD